jgi:hypothetical protein
VDSDCRKVPIQCGGCTCVALGLDQVSPPPCSDFFCPLDRCIYDPYYANAPARCVSGQCVVP